MLKTSLSTNSSPPSSPSGTVKTSGSPSEPRNSGFSDNAEKAEKGFSSATEMEKPLLNANAGTPMRRRLSQLSANSLSKKNNQSNPLEYAVWLRTYEIPMEEAGMNARREDPFLPPRGEGKDQVHALQDYKIADKRTNAAKKQILRNGPSAALYRTESMFKNIAAAYPEEEHEDDYVKELVNVFKNNHHLHAPFFNMSYAQCEIFVDELVKMTRPEDSSLSTLNLNYSRCIKKDLNVDGPELEWEDAAFWLHKLNEKHDKTKIGLDLSLNDINLISQSSGVGFPEFMDFLKEKMQKGIFSSLNFYGTSFVVKKGRSKRNYGAEIIRSLPPHSPLKYLNLNGTNLQLPAPPLHQSEPKGVDFLSECLRDSGITHFNVGHNSFKENSFHTIINALPGSNMTHLSINHTDLSLEDIRLLFEALKKPDCNVTHIDLSGIRSLEGHAELLAELVNGTKLAHVGFTTDPDFGPPVLNQEQQELVSQALASNAQVEKKDT